jgi:hypothetical protein
MKPEDISKELWSLANIITGFSITQSLASALALPGNGYLHFLHTWPWYYRVLASIIPLIFACLYAYGVWRCWQLADPQGTQIKVWREVTIGRVACIWIFSFVLIIGAFAP